jgi:MYXO-CTERM domain-containing protein
MKHRVILLAAAPVLAPSAWGDVIYSGYQNIAVPLDFNGVYLNIATGATASAEPGNWATVPWINPFFGGVYIANDVLLRPVITPIAQYEDQIVKLATGTLVGSGSTFVAGVNGSSTHVGGAANQFAIGIPGNLGFQFEATPGGTTQYGWLNTTINNTGAGVIRDWAYDNAGGSIIVGRVQQSAPVLGAQTFTLSPGSGESFALGSAISDTGGNVNSLVKTGDGATTLTLANSYTGTTAVIQGSLIINGNQAAATGAVTVSGGAKLTGTGTVGGATTMIGGTLGAGLTFNGTDVSSSLAFSSGSVFEWDINAAGTASATSVEGNLSGADATFRIVLDDFSGGFWTTDHAWSLTDIFGTTDITGTFASIFTTLDSNLNAVNGGRGFTLSGSTLSFAAVPEPTGAVVALLLGAAALRRRRTA